MSGVLPHVGLLVLNLCTHTFDLGYLWNSGNEKGTNDGKRDEQSHWSVHNKAKVT